jgi:hypothetical protein
MNYENHQVQQLSLTALEYSSFLTAAATTKQGRRTKAGNYQIIISVIKQNGGGEKIMAEQTHEPWEAIRKWGMPVNPEMS